MLCHAWSRSCHQRCCSTVRNKRIGTIGHGLAEFGFLTQRLENFNALWVMYAKTDSEKAETIMNIAIQIAGSLAILSAPFMPFSSDKLKAILALRNITWNDAGTIFITTNHQINKPAHLFEKIEDDKIEQQKTILKEQ